MRLSLELVVIAIVILIAAVVIIAFFAMGVSQAGQITDARNQCITTASASCNSVKIMPPTWKIETIRAGNEMWSCDKLTGKHDCGDFGVTGGGVTPITTTAACTGKGYTCEETCQAGKIQQGSCSDNPDPKKKVCCG